MREYLSKKFIVETLQAHPGQAFTKQELSSVTEIPIKTLASQLRQLIRANKIQKKTITMQKWNKRKDRRIEQSQVWYYLKTQDGST